MLCGIEAEKSLHKRAVKIGFDNPLERQCNLSLLPVSYMLTKEKLAKLKNALFILKIYLFRS